MPPALRRVVLSAVLAATAVALAASSAGAQIAPTATQFMGGSPGVTFASSWGNVICSASTLSGTTPSSPEATSIEVTEPSFSGCNTTLGGPATVTTRGTWRLGYESSYVSPGTTSATWSLPSEAATISMLGGLCVVTIGSSTLGESGTHQWIDGGEQHNQDEPLPSQVVFTGAGTLNETGCFGATTGTFSAHYMLMDTETPVAFWAGAPRFGISPNPMRFPATRRGTTARREVTLENDSENDVDVKRITVIGDRVFDVPIGEGVRIRANSSSRIEVRFTPPAAAEYRARIQFQDETGRTIWTLEVRGRGE
jgi:Abnormal spindle-like microcephaly-assoc'd, ASPM-SPD-2-Hydin